MFASGTLQPTYSGPIYATGETFRQQRNTERALAGLLGDSRSYRQQGRGIGAGGKLDRFRSGLTADRAAHEQLLRSQQAMFEEAANAAESRFEFEANRAGEFNRLRSLMLERDRIDQSFSLAKRGDDFDADLFVNRQAAEREAAKRQRRSSLFGTLLGIV
jgi:hypothetical protein